MEQNNYSLPRREENYHLARSLYNTSFRISNDSRKYLGSYEESEKGCC